MASPRLAARIDCSHWPDPGSVRRLQPGFGFDAYSISFPIVPRLKSRRRATSTPASSRSLLVEALRTRRSGPGEVQRPRPAGYRQLLRDSTAVRIAHDGRSLKSCLRQHDIQIGGQCRNVVGTISATASHGRAGPAEAVRKRPLRSWMSGSNIAPRRQRPCRRSTLTLTSRPEARCRSMHDAFQSADVDIVVLPLVRKAEGLDAIA